MDPIFSVEITQSSDKELTTYFPLGNAHRWGYVLHPFILDLNWVKKSREEPENFCFCLLHIFKVVFN